MRVRSLIIYVVSFLSFPIAFANTGLAEDQLQIFDDVWVSINPPGPHIFFNKIGQHREASLPILGQAAINTSKGEDGSNYQISGPGFICYYFILTTSKRTKMVWELKSGPSVCFKNAVFERVDTGIDEQKANATAPVAIVASKTSEPISSPVATPNSDSAKIQDRPPVASPGAVSAGSSFWWHNGSQLELKSTDDGERWFYYSIPSDRMAAVVSKGTLLFDGRRNGNTYSGTVRRFHPTCGVTEYAVKGEVQAEVRIVLRGSYPRKDPNTCQTIQFVNDELEFVYVRTPSPDENAKIVTRGR